MSTAVAEPSAAESSAGGSSTGEVAPAKPGRGELGAITIADRVVGKLAARAALEIPDAGGAAPRLLGRSLAGLAGAAPAGIRETSLDALPKTSADVDGSIVALTIELSVRWPASIPATTQQVREHVQQRIQELTGLTVAQIAIHVTDLVTHLDPPPRVL